MKPQIMILKINKVLLTVFFTFFVFVGYSQDPPTPQAGTNDGIIPPPAPGLPIDGGLTYLIIAGTAFGVYKLRKKY